MTSATTLAQDKEPVPVTEKITTDVSEPGTEPTEPTAEETKMTEAEKEGPIIEEESDPSDVGSNSDDDFVLDLEYLKTTYGLEIPDQTAPEAERKDALIKAVDILKEKNAYLDCVEVLRDLISLLVADTNLRDLEVGYYCFMTADLLLKQMENSTDILSNCATSNRDVVHFLIIARVAFENHFGKPGVDRVGVEGVDVEPMNKEVTVAETEEIAAAIKSADEKIAELEAKEKEETGAQNESTNAEMNDEEVASSATETVTVSKEYTQLLSSTVALVPEIVFKMGDEGVNEFIDRTNCYNIQEIMRNIAALEQETNEKKVEAETPSKEDKKDTQENDTNEKKVEATESTDKNAEDALSPVPTKIPSFPNDFYLSNKLVTMQDVDTAHSTYIRFGDTMQSLGNHITSAEMYLNALAFQLGAGVRDHRLFPSAIALAQELQLTGEYKECLIILDFVLKLIKAIEGFVESKLDVPDHVVSLCPSVKESMTSTIEEVKTIMAKPVTTNPDNLTTNQQALLRVIGDVDANETGTKKTFDTSVLGSNAAVKVMAVKRTSQDGEVAAPPAKKLKE